MGVAIGCATRDRTVAFASTFAAFFSRAYDQIRMGAISQTNVNLVGSHCGVSIGKPDTYIPVTTFLQGWRKNVLLISNCAPLQEKTVPLRWPWRTWPCSAPSQHALCFIPVMRCPRKGLLSCLQTQKLVLQFCGFDIDIKETKFILFIFSRVSVSSVPADQTLQFSTPQMRSLKWALPRY